MIAGHYDIIDLSEVCILPTHDTVLEQYEKVKNFAVIDGFLTKA